MKLPIVLESIPDKYKEECEYKGKVERIDYEATTYDDKKMPKYAFVYTPYNYDETKEYEILYLNHGGGEYAEKYLYEKGEENPLKRIVDHMIYEGVIKPCIIVTPSEYPYNRLPDEEENANSENFLRNYAEREIVEELIPLVEAKYSTYAKGTSKEELMKARDHRAVMGWSMGSVTTWFIMMKNMAYFNRFGNMSCGCFVMGPNGGRDYPVETVEKLLEALKAEGTKPEDYTNFIVTGTNDKARPNVEPQVLEMKKHPEMFIFDGENQNTNYLLWEGGEHHTPWRIIYTYNVIKHFMK